MNEKRRKATPEKVADSDDDPGYDVSANPGGYSNPPPESSPSKVALDFDMIFEAGDKGVGEFDDQANKEIEELEDLGFTFGGGEPEGSNDQDKSRADSKHDDFMEFLIAQGLNVSNVPSQKAESKEPSGQRQKEEGSKKKKKKKNREPTTQALGLDDDILASLVQESEQKQQLADADFGNDLVNQQFGSQTHQQSQEPVEHKQPTQLQAPLPEASNPPTELQRAQTEPALKVDDLDQDILAQIMNFQNEETPGNVVEDDGSMKAVQGITNSNKKDDEPSSVVHSNENVTPDGPACWEELPSDFAKAFGIDPTAQQKEELEPKGQLPSQDESQAQEDNFMQALLKDNKPEEAPNLAQLDGIDLDQFIDDFKLGETPGGPPSETPAGEPPASEPPLNNDQGGEPASNQNEFADFNLEDMIAQIESKPQETMATALVGQAPPDERAAPDEEMKEEEKVEAPPNIDDEIMMLLGSNLAFPGVDSLEQKAEDPPKVDASQDLEVMVPQQPVPEVEPQPVTQEALQIVEAIPSFADEPTGQEKVPNQFTHQPALSVPEPIKAPNGEAPQPTETPGDVTDPNAVMIEDDIMQQLLGLNSDGAADGANAIRDLGDLGNIEEIQGVGGTSGIEDNEGQVNNADKGEAMADDDQLNLLIPPNSDDAEVDGVAANLVEAKEGGATQEDLFDFQQFLQSQAENDSPEFPQLEESKGDAGKQEDVEMKDEAPATFDGQTVDDIFAQIQAENLQQIQEKPPPSGIELPAGIELPGEEPMGLDEEILKQFTMGSEKPLDEMFIDSKPKDTGPKPPRAHFHLTDFYTLKKIKYTLEFQSPLSAKKLKKGQYIYTFDLKDEEDIIAIIEEYQAKGHKCLFIDLGVHTKQFLIRDLSILALKPDQPESQTKKKRYIKQVTKELPTPAETYGAMKSLKGPSGAAALNGQQTQLGQSSEQVKKAMGAKQWYVTPAMQANFFATHLNGPDSFGKPTYQFAKDLNTIDYLQKDLCWYSEGNSDAGSLSGVNQVFQRYFEKKPELHVSRFSRLQIKNKSSKEVFDELSKELKISISVGVTDNGGEPEILSNFGIQAIDYRAEEATVNLDKGADGVQLDTYFITQDGQDSSHLWLPQIFGTSNEPVLWSMNYLIPSEAQVVSSGDFIRKKDFTLPPDASGNREKKTLYTFKSKFDADQEKRTGRLLPSKIGFIVGAFGYYTEISGQTQQRLGTAAFVNLKKHQQFLSDNFYSTQIDDIVQDMERILHATHPCRDQAVSGSADGTTLKILFVPNLFLRKSLKQSVDFAGCIHIMDQEILMPRNVLEKKHKLHKILGTSLAFDFFGFQVWESCFKDTWLLQGLRERLGDTNYKKKVGNTMYRYQIMKRQEKFASLIENNAERFSLSSIYFSHFSEMQLGEDVYILKCQLIMHILEQILGETHLFTIMSELFKKSSPELTMELLKRLLRERSMRVQFQSIQQNWIESVGCPELSCDFNFIKKNNCVDLHLRQSNVAKAHLLLKNKVDTTENIEEDLCEDGRFLMGHLKAEDRQNEAPLAIDPQREMARGFTGKIEIVIYETDGADIKVETQQIELSQGKSKEKVTRQLICKVKKAIMKKKEDNFMDDLRNPADMSESVYERPDQLNSLLSLKAEHLHQTLNDQNKWQFGGLLDYIFDRDFVEENRSLFEAKNIDSPILWVRVDPHFKFIRRVSVEQSKENWIFQLLQERDPISQIEACKNLAQFGTSEDVYKVLKAVAMNEYFFFKVRKHALRALEKIQVSAFRQLLSYEKTYLIHYFKQRNFNDKIGFYKANDFSNVLEYYVNTYLLRSLSKSKESPLMVRQELDVEFKKQVEGVIRNLPLSYSGQNHFRLKNTLKMLRLKVQEEEKHDDDNQIIKAIAKQQELAVEVDTRYFCSTTTQVSALLLALLNENDNSENPFDDSFYRSKILMALGKLDNFEVMPQIAREVQKQLNLDHIGSFSPQYSITKGALKAYFSLRKQIFRFRHFKQPYLNEDGFIFFKQIEGSLLEAEAILGEIKKKIDRIVTDKHWPLEVRAFIFERQIKEAFLYTEPPLPGSAVPKNFLNPLYHAIKSVRGFISGMQFQFGSLALEILTTFIEKNYLKKLNFKECTRANDMKCKVIADELWYLVAELPVTFLDRKISFWSKRLFGCIFIRNPFKIQEEASRIDPPKEISSGTIIDGNWAPPFDEAIAPNQLNQFYQFVNQTALAKDPVPQQPRQKTSPAKDEIFDQLIMDPDFQNPLGRGGSNQKDTKKKKSKPENELMTPQKDDRHRQNHLPGSNSKQSAQGDNYQRITYDNWPGDAEEEAPIDDQDIVIKQEVDDFPDYKFEEIWKQKCWDILYLLYYDYDATIFICEISKETFGDDLYEDYMSRIKRPMTFLTIKQKMINQNYLNAQQFVNDMNLVFSNCIEFNSRNSSHYKSAVKLKKKLKDQVTRKGLTKHLSK